MAVELLELGGGTLDLGVVVGRDAIFLIPTTDDLSSYTWTGQVNKTDGTPVGAFTFTVTSSQATVKLPRAVTAALAGIPLSAYEIVLTAPGGASMTPLLSGAVRARPGQVS